MTQIDLVQVAGKERLEVHGEEHSLQPIEGETAFIELRFIIDGVEYIITAGQCDSILWLRRRMRVEGEVKVKDF